jgi:hypothetical protein
MIRRRTPTLSHSIIPRSSEGSCRTSKSEATSPRSQETAPPADEGETFVWPHTPFRHGALPPEAASRRPPTGWTWHRGAEPGVMQLVPKVQRTTPWAVATAGPSGWSRTILDVGKP